MMQRLSNQLFGGSRTLLRRGALFMFAGVMALVVTVSPLATRPASALSFSLTGNSCAIETVGWVVCPTMRSIARLADYGFSYINQSSLAINYKIFDNSSKTFKAWEIMRNIANGMFVVVFLYIIYGYLIGRTGGNYTIKRLLPRLVITAIVVNTSYFLGVILVDISNIIGDSIWSILKNIYGNGSPVMPIGGSANPLSDGNLTKMAAAAMGNTGMVWVLMPLIAAVTITVAIISAAMVILVIMREALVAALIFASPLLIVLYILPNVERFSGQAIRLFLQLLLLYPIIALLLGTGQIVSLAAGSWSNTSAFYGGGTMSIVPDLVAAAAAVVPLLAVWFVFKNMSSIMNAAGTRLTASISGRRGGGKDDEKARVTGNATAGAANNKNTGGLLGPMNRRQAYSRNRRHSSLGNSSLPGVIRSSGGEGGAGGLGGVGGEGGAGGLGGGGGAGGLGGDGGITDVRPEVASGAALQNTLNNVINPGDTTAKLEGQQEARVEADVKSGGVDAGEIAKSLSTSELQTQEKEKKKQVTAKDIFNSLNKDRGHSSKDKDRKFGAGPAPAGGGGGEASSVGQPSAPVASYQAPQIAQGSNNVVSGSSAPQQPVQVIAVPVQVDASTLLGQNHPPDNVSQPPISGTEEKAKARAQKYLFDTEKDLSEARNADDILKHANGILTEQPHTSSAPENGDKEDER
ncbi:MAG: hypothetical protein H6797_05890 [Candidatus Nomurabacteria bacterium]|nr:MAG: hypothetical protein H6797_05890 [Candidatus Nomurabacteria bacterium]